MKLRKLIVSYSWTFMVPFILLALLIFSHFFFSWKPFVRIASSTLFSDLGLVLGNLDCFRLSSSSWSPTNTDCDPLGRPFIYPVEFIYTLEFFPPRFFNLNNINLIGLFSCLILILSLWIAVLRVKKSNTETSFLYKFIVIIIVTSPPILFLMERANVEILVFVLLILAMLLGKRFPYLSSLCVLASAFIKIYPIFILLLISFVARNKKLALWNLFLFILGSFFLLPQAREISNLTSHFSFNSYGLGTFGLLGCYSSQPSEIVPEGIEPLAISNLNPLCDLSEFFPVVLLMAILGLVILYTFTSFRITLTNMISSLRMLGLGRPTLKGQDYSVLNIFGTCFVSSFFSPTNYDYRLVLIVPLILQILDPQISITNWLYRPTALVGILALQLSVNEWFVNQMIGDVFALLFLVIVLNSLSETNEIVKRLKRFRLVASIIGTSRRSA